MLLELGMFFQRMIVQTFRDTQRIFAKLQLQNHVVQCINVINEIES